MTWYEDDEFEPVEVPFLTVDYTPPAVVGELHVPGVGVILVLEDRGPFGFARGIQ